MRNLSPAAEAVLRARLSLLPKRNGALQTRMEKAVGAFQPVGWCAGVRRANGEKAFAWGGDAVAGRQPASPETRFRVASISKTVMSAGVLLLAQEGKLSLDEDVSQVFGFPCGFTPRQLLTHTAALTDEAYNCAIDAGEFPALNLLLEKSRAPWRPGERFHYSNLGAGIAGMLIEKTADMPFDDFIREKFFLPHGVDASFHPQRIAAKECLANCYRVPGNTLAYDAQRLAALPLDETVNPLAHYNVPAGKLMISAPALLDTVARLSVDFPALHAPQGNIGRELGMAITRGVFRRKGEIVGHQGVAYGAICEAWLNPEDGTAAVLLTNGARLSSIGGLQRLGQNGIAALFDFVYE